MAKVQIVKYLHEQLGFDVVAFESGFEECRRADERLSRDIVVEAMQTCLLTQFHHRELMSLFDHAAGTRSSSNPLRVAGMDFQVQSKISRLRSAMFAEPLRSASAERADQLATLASAYVDKSFAPTEEKIQWVHEHGRTLKALEEAARARRWSGTGRSRVAQRRDPQAVMRSDDARTPRS